MKLLLPSKDRLDILDTYLIGINNYYRRERQELLDKKSLDNDIVSYDINERYDLFDRQIKDNRDYLDTRTGS